MPRRGTPAFKWKAIERKPIRGRRNLKNRDGSATLGLFRLSIRRDRAYRLRALAHEAEVDPTGLAIWAIASDLWMGGDVAAAFRFAEKALRASPNDFRLILICLTYYIRSRDSAQIYTFAERLVAAKNPAPQLRLDS